MVLRFDADCCCLLLLVTLLYGVVLRSAERCSQLYCCLIYRGAKYGDVAVNTGLVLIC